MFLKRGNPNTLVALFVDCIFLARRRKSQLHVCKFFGSVGNRNTMFAHVYLEANNPMCIFCTVLKPETQHTFCPLLPFSCTPCVATFLNISTHPVQHVRGTPNPAPILLYVLATQHPAHSVLPLFQPHGDTQPKNVAHIVLRQTNPNSCTRDKFR